MQLLYIHALKFRHFQDIGFSLRGDYQILQTETTLRVQYFSKLTPPHLFCPNISSVHAIVGRNATGKTNLADLIGLTIPHRLKQQDQQWRLSHPAEKQAYFLLYLPDRPALPQNVYYLEIFNNRHGSYQNLFKNLPASDSWSQFWVQLTDEGVVLPYNFTDTPCTETSQPAAQYHTHILLSREALSPQTFDPDGQWFSSFSGNTSRLAFYDTSAPSSPHVQETVHKESPSNTIFKATIWKDIVLSDATLDSIAKLAQHSISTPLPSSQLKTTTLVDAAISRAVFANQRALTASEIRTLRTLKKFLASPKKTQVIDGQSKKFQNSPPFNDAAYYISFSWDRSLIAQPLFREVSAELLNPEPLSTDMGQRKLVLYFISYILSCTAGYNDLSVFRTLQTQLGKLAAFLCPTEPIPFPSLSRILAKEEITTFFTVLSEHNPILLRGLSSLGRPVSSLLDMLENLDFTETSDRENSCFSFVIPIDTVSASALNALEFLERDECAVFFATFFHRTWLNVSDGEAHFVQSFAALYDKIRPVFLGADGISRAETPAADKTVHTFILVLDEPEVHMHPDLERQYLYLLIHWLNTTLSAATFQIILLTHSPFLLSEIDRTHVLLLRRAPDNALKAEHPVSQTFAANIHTILNEPLFLDSPFGSIATQHIKALMQLLRHDRTDESVSILSDYSDEQLDAIISLTGEPLLRNSLHFLFQEYQKKHLSKEEHT